MAIAPVSLPSTSSLVDRFRALRRDLASFDPAVVSGADCAEVVAEAAAMEKVCAAVKALAAAKASSCGAHRAAGFADAGEWLARHSGTTARAARAAIDTALSLASCSDTREAALEGSVSLAEAAEIVRTEVARPGSESELLQAVRRTGFSAMRNRAQRLRQEATEVAVLQQRRHAARHVRHWRTEVGNVGGTFELPPEIGIPFVNRLDAETARVRKEARRAGDTSARWEAHAADAFARLVDRRGDSKSRTRSDLVVVVDLRAYRRGHAHAGEPCHVIGGGPIPVELARELGRDAFVKGVLHDGVAIHTVRHFGRHIPVELRTALELGPVPLFDGIECSEPSCGHRQGLQWDHVDPVANDGPTSFANLDPKCWRHHAEKTERDRLAGLLDRRVAEERREARLRRGRDGPP